MKYKINLRDECGGSDAIDITADSDEQALAMARDAAIEWIKGGAWSQSGCSVSVYYTLETDTDIWDEEEEYVEIEPNEEALMLDAGLDPDCDHDWVSTVEVDGGLTENPGVCMLGGTAISEDAHCERCGAHKKVVHHGSQRNPGEPEKSVSFWIE